MRIYKDPMEMIKEVERDLFEMGLRYQSKTVQDQDVAEDPDFQTVELFGYSYQLLPPFRGHELLEMVEYTDGGNKEMIDRMCFRKWVVNEAQERIHGPVGGSAERNPGEAWQIYDSFWDRFIRDGFFSYSYCERWMEQIPYVIRELFLRPQSRQAMITMYDRHQDMMNWGGRDRVPCSVSYQFAIREDQLFLIYNQRSCDFIKFFAADIFFTIALQEYIAGCLGIECGPFIHFLGSIHAFAGDLKGRNIF